MIHKINIYLLYASTIFLSAFLLFQIQPIVSKHILPWFGGSASVWTTSMVFFTSTLLAGYLYTYLLTKQSHKIQYKVHSILIGIGIFFILILYIFQHSLYPNALLLTSIHIPATLLTLLILTITIGIPYFILATTGPLLQLWYGEHSKKEPYKLYAISNSGSLLALFSYPLLLEPFLKGTTQEHLWTFSFLLSSRSILHIQKKRTARKKEVAKITDTITTFTKATWVLLAAIPAFILITTTTKVTQTVAQVPLLWLIPLSMYLTTFILAFANRGKSSFLATTTFITGLFAFYLVYSTIPIVSTPIYILFFFLAAFLFHRELYKKRPTVHQLPKFYLFISIGGALGTIVASILPPLFFSTLLEFPLGIILVLSITIFFIPKIILSDFSNNHQIGIKIATIALICIGGSYFVYTKNNTIDALSTTRNYYGEKKVVNYNNVRVLTNGKIIHGLQFLEKEREFTPLMYYAQNSGIGLTIKFLRRSHTSLSVGVVGLGTGTLAAYCTPKDTFTFYEIDPQVIDIAQKHFTYLNKCPQYTLQIGDARLQLQKQTKDGLTKQFDILIMDAFSDDAIPIHLLTKEAFDVYKTQLRTKDSLIAVHISNRYLDLFDVVARTAKESGLSVVQISTSSSRWVLLTQNKKLFKQTPKIATDAPLWTDSYSNILPLFTFWDIVKKYALLIVLQTKEVIHRDILKITH